MRKRPTFPGEDGGSSKIPHRRRGQNMRRKGSRVSQDNGKAPCCIFSPRASHWLTAETVLRKKEKPGCEQSRPRNQWRIVEASATRWGSLRVGAADSQEQRSTKYCRRD